MSGVKIASVASKLQREVKLSEYALEQAAPLKEILNNECL